MWDAVAWCRCCQGCLIWRVTRRSWRKEIDVRRSGLRIFRSLLCDIDVLSTSQPDKDSRQMLRWSCFADFLSEEFLHSFAYVKFSERFWEGTHMQCCFRRLLVTSEASGCLCDGEAKVLHCHVFSGSGSGGQVPIGMSICNIYIIRRYVSFVDSRGSCRIGLDEPCAWGLQQPKFSQACIANPNSWCVITVVLWTIVANHTTSLSLKSVGRVAMCQILSACIFIIETLIYSSSIYLSCFQNSGYDFPVWPGICFMEVHNKLSILSPATRAAAPF